MSGQEGWAVATSVERAEGDEVEDVQQALRPVRQTSAAAHGQVTLGFVDLSALIDIRPEVRGGKPCFVGTRIAVYDVLEYLASGMTHEEIMSDFPELTEAHIRAALAFAALREHRLAAPA